MQTNAQNDPSKSSRQRRAEAIAELIAVLKSDSEPVSAIKRSFAEIGRTLPQVLLEVARRIRDAQVREAEAQAAARTKPNEPHAQTPGGRSDA